MEALEESDDLQVERTRVAVEVAWKELSTCAVNFVLTTELIRPLTQIGVRG